MSTVYHIQVGYYASNNSTDHRLQCVSGSLPGRTLWKCNSLVRNERLLPELLYFGPLQSLFP